ncbi:MAG: TlpA family protein disulfide reductase, partial [Gammaproteobacteria bacterium]|nr:TlpA family protein disulfide reductase [Gammaproteobacteria bacterium]
FLLDAEFSTTALRIQNLAQALGTGGSQIYTQIIKNVERRFQSKQDSELSPNDLTAKQNFAKTLDQAFRLLSITDVPDSAVASDLQTSRYSRVPKRNTSLIEVTDPVLAPQLKLPGFDESVYTLEKYLGKIILVNFWASWCGPCVEEIPSLHRLKSKVQNPQFEIVTVNIGESRERIGDFLQQVPIEFPVLMDVDGTASKQWNVHFYPSNYLVDQRGIIRYVHQGALEWDSPENIEIIQKLLLP